MGRWALAHGASMYDSIPTKLNLLLISRETPVIQRKRSTIDEYLRTGVLRGITEGTSVREIGKELGPPTSWWGRDWEHNIPLIWYYGDVEIILNNDDEPKVIELALGRKIYGNAFKSSKLIRNVECEPYPNMTLDEFIEYADKFGHAISEYTWSWQHIEEEKVFIIDEITTAIFTPAFGDDDQYRLYEFHSGLEGLPDFHKDPRSKHFAEYRRRVDDPNSEAGCS